MEISNILFIYIFELFYFCNLLISIEKTISNFFIQNLKEKQIIKMTKTNIIYQINFEFQLKKKKITNFFHKYKISSS